MGGKQMSDFNYSYDINRDLLLNREQFLINQVIKRRNIRWLCHFTPHKNLENIKRYGLKTRNSLSDSEAIFTDSYRHDQHKNSICLSISKPNKWMFSKKQEQGYELCLLLIDPEVLYKKKCLFYPHNAATSSYRNINIETLKGEAALENMFANPISFQKSGCNPTNIYRNNYLGEYETTSDQAEVQCLENIEPKYIKYIFKYSIPLSYDEIKSEINKYQLSKNLPERNASDSLPQKPKRNNTRKVVPATLKNELAIGKRQEIKRTEYSSNPKNGSSGDGCFYTILFILFIWYIL